MGPRIKAGKIELVLNDGTVMNTPNPRKKWSSMTRREREYSKKAIVNSLNRHLKGMDWSLEIV